MLLEQTPHQNRFLWVRAQQNHYFSVFIPAHSWLQLINKFLGAVSQQTCQDTALTKMQQVWAGFPKAECWSAEYEHYTPQGVNSQHTPGSQELIRGYQTQKHWENIKNCLKTNLSALPESSFRQHFRSYRFWKWILGALRGFSRSGEGIGF